MKILEKLSQKQKQRALLFGIIAILALGCFLTVSVFEKSGGRGKKPAPSKKVVAVLTEKVDKDKWMEAEDQNIRGLQKSDEETKRATDDLTEQVKFLKEELKNTKAQMENKSDPKNVPVKKAGLNAPIPHGNATTKTANQPESFPMENDKSDQRKGSAIQTPRDDHGAASGAGKSST